MKVEIIVGNPTKNSINHALAEGAMAALRENGHEVIYHDLYAEGFDPVLPAAEIPKKASLDPAIEKHCREAAGADGLIIIHPNWWGQPPAILKGWVDRVLRAGVAFEFAPGDGGEGTPVGLLKAQVALVFNTSNTPPERELAVFGDPLETLWNNCIFSFCGVPRFFRKTYSVVVTSTPEQRAAWVEDVRDIVRNHFPADSTAK